MISPATRRRLSGTKIEAPLSWLDTPSAVGSRAPTAVDYTELVRGVVMVAAAAKAYPAGFSGAKELSEAVRKSGDPALAESERLKFLRLAVFAPGRDASVWLKGWHPDVDQAQSAAGRATKQSEW